MRSLVLVSLLALAGCTSAPPVAENTDAAVEGSGGTLPNLAASAGNAVAEAIVSDGWLGRWTGVEGTYLIVSSGDAPGRYRLEMQYTLDDKASLDGTATADGIAFSRRDGAQLLRATDGKATGLKHLADKKDCLTVKPGEGYCRD